MHFVSSDGFDIYVGKNNTQNDYLTLKFANSSDLWFHTKNIHGSHTIIKLGLDKDVPKTTITEAAELAAYYSKGRDSSQVPVDFTQIKNVKKPNGAKPGMVIYDYYNTIYVTPKELKMSSQCMTTRFRYKLLYFFHKFFAVFTFFHFADTGNIQKFAIRNRTFTAHFTKCRILKYNIRRNTCHNGTSVTKFFSLSNSLSSSDVKTVSFL